jgi:hypothetical protein
MGLSNAERQARWRERHKDETVPLLRARLKELEAHIRELEVAGRAPAADKGAAAPPHSAAAEARIRELEAEVARLKAATPEWQPKTPEDWASCAGRPMRTGAIGAPPPAPQRPRKSARRRTLN